MEHTVELFHKEMGYWLCDGFSVNMGWYNAVMRINQQVTDMKTGSVNDALTPGTKRRGL